MYFRSECDGQLGRGNPRCCLSIGVLGYQHERSNRIRATMASYMVSVTALPSQEDTTYISDGPNGTTSELRITAVHFRSPDTRIMSFIFVICISGFIANLAMLVGLLVKKHSASKTVNVFICNQTVLDLVATFVSAVKLSLVMSGYLKTKAGVPGSPRESHCRQITPVSYTHLTLPTILRV